jgi:exodeoxyribonuclease V gamma subunit
MRSVPHRVVCLLGMDDGVFPRKAPRDGDDLMLVDPHVGERDPRSEDRQLLLDALMAATDRLVVTYTGNDERTNVPRPAAVPVGELLDAVDMTVRAETGAARDRVLVRHPLQPFDPRNFTSGALGRRTPWSFDRATLEGAQALTRDREEPKPFLSGPLPPLPHTVIALDDLVRFVRHPVRAFLRARLRITLGDYSDQVEDGLPVELDGLEEWAVGERLLEAMLGGLSMDAAVDAEMARGTLPPGQLARPVVARLRPVVERIVADARDALRDGPEARSADTMVALPDGRTVSGTVVGLHADALLTATYSRVNPRHRLVAWVQLLALTAAHPEVAWEAVTVGRASADAPDRASVTVARIPPLGGDAATQELTVLIDLWERGMREPLPLACQTSAAYAQAAARGSDPKAAGRRAWESRWNYPKEDQELEHQLTFGGVRTFAELLELEPQADECGDGWENRDPSRLGRYSRRLWDGLLAREQQEHR